MSPQFEAEVEGVHDRLREAYEAALEDDWDRYNELLKDARSNGLQRKAELERGGSRDV